MWALRRELDVTDCRRRRLDLALLALAAGRLACGLGARLRRRKVGLDISALVPIGETLALGEYVAAGVIGVMLSGGRSLEGFAEARAGRKMSPLLASVPRTANRYEGATLATVSLDGVVAG